MKTSRLLIIALAPLTALVLSSMVSASSIAVATGTATVDGRPVLFKNRDHWSTPDGWKVHTYNYTADLSSFGSGDRYTARFNYLGVTAEGDSGLDLVSGATIPWAGANDRGLALTQVAGHTLTSDFATQHGFSVSQDLTRGMSGGYLNHLVLSRCETVDEVEQVLRDTNNGGGFPGTGVISTARNTSSIIAVSDRWGNAAIFEMDGDSFTRDNITATYLPTDVNGNNVIRWVTPHNDDKDQINPADGAYHGYDWRNNFSKVQWTKPNNFPYLRDVQITTVDANGDVDNFGSVADGIHDWETSPSAVWRHRRTGDRIDDPYEISDPSNPPFQKDYRFFMQKYVGDGALPLDGDIETVSRSIGDLPYTDDTDPNDHKKPTGYHINRFVTTMSTVFIGAKINDPYEGKLVASWICLGEPAVGLFVPVFPYAAQLPAELTDMYAAINTKRHLVYTYTIDDADGYDNGRNVDHAIDTVALAGANGYYGDGGIHKYTFEIEDWGFDQYDGFMASLRTGTRTLVDLKTDMTDWQANIIRTMKTFYVNSQWPNSYEAESWANTLRGSAVRVKNSLMSWGGKVITIGGAASTNDITFQKVRVDGAGTYEIKIHYTSSTTRNLDLSINGAAATTLVFPASGGANTLATLTISAPLGVGYNALRFFNNTTNVTPGLDRIEILNPDIIIDNTSVGFSTVGTGWNSQTTFAGYYGSDYLSDGTTAADAATKYAQWVPTIAVAGTYRISMRWSAYTSRPGAAPVQIQYDGGLDTSKIVNQQTNGGQWVTLGAYQLSAGTGNYVRLLCTDAGFTIADAVRFEKQL
jgi:hypothetical protein